ncbi:MAG: peptide deformylase [Anaerolineales bacterium]
MTVKPILMIGNPTLREKSGDVSFEADGLTEIIRDLADTLHNFQRATGIGRAIAGIQIGYPKKVVYMEAGGRSIVMINPRIIERSEETFKVWDSCFSADVAFFGKTVRNRAITVTYCDENQNEITERFEDDLSELFQHEIDHLDGVLFTDRIINNEIIMRSEWEKL